MLYDKSTQASYNQARVSDSHRSGHLANLASSRLKPLDWSVELGIRRIDVAIFLAASRGYDHIICVRSTNTKSLCYVGQKMFTPKPIDCKPKTSDMDVYVPAVGIQVACAGLVVDPTVMGSAAFKGNKFDKVCAAWTSFLKDKTCEEQQKKVFRRRESKGFYAVDNYKQSNYYGCLMLSDQDIPASQFNLADRDWQEFKRDHMCYIHGDYDLYGLIDVAKIESAVYGPSGRDKVSPKLLVEQLHGIPHIYTEHFPQIKEFLNRGIGTEMIQHASQDNLAHQDDELYVFYPFGGAYRLDATADQIRDIYLRLFDQDVRS